jgi:hypothetical protein
MRFISLLGFVGGTSSDVHRHISNRMLHEELKNIDFPAGLGKCVSDHENTFVYYFAAKGIYGWGAKLPDVCGQFADNDSRTNLEERATALGEIEASLRPEVAAVWAKEEEMAKEANSKIKSKDGAKPILLAEIGAAKHVVERMDFSEAHGFGLKAKHAILRELEEMHKAVLMRYP